MNFNQLSPTGNEITHEPNKISKGSVVIIHPVNNMRGVAEV
jgi:hypothetical protein